MSDDYWGPEIVVNGQCPSWLTVNDLCDLRTESGWCYSSSREPHYLEPKEWAWMHSNGEVNIQAIRLSKDHPYYVWKPAQTAPKIGMILIWGNLVPHPEKEVLYSHQRLTFAVGYWDSIDEAWTTTSSTWKGPWIDPIRWTEMPASPNPRYFG